jgi:hypothetical protein
MTWYVVAGADDREEPEECWWTLSQSPISPGWETDSGCPGYGLPKAQAEELVTAANAFGRFEEFYRLYREVYMDTQRHPTAAQEATVMALANNLKDVFKS